MEGAGVWPWWHRTSMGSGGGGVIDGGGSVVGWWVVAMGMASAGVQRAAHTGQGAFLSKAVQTAAQ